MSEKSNEGDILARLRTLYALERNYLAMQRNQLAKIRTGLALSLFAPPIILFTISLGVALNLTSLLLLIIILVGIVTYGLWMILSAHTRLTKVRKRLLLVRKRENQIIKLSTNLFKMFGDLGTDLNNVE